MDFGDSVNLTAGKEYEAVVFFHNNANASLNANGTGIAQGAYARVELPAIVPLEHRMPIQKHLSVHRMPIRNESMTIFRCSYQYRHGVTLGCWVG